MHGKAGKTQSAALCVLLLSVVDVDGGSVVGRAGVLVGVCLAEGLEDLADVDVFLRGRLEEEDAVRSRVLPRALAVDLPGVLREIALVSAERDDRVGHGLLPHVLDPLLRALERVRVRHVVCDDRELGPAVVHRGDRGEALLPGCVPDLELELLPADADDLRQKRRPQRRRLALRERIPREAQRDARLPHLRRAQQDELPRWLLHTGSGNLFSRIFK